jgi:hypothetical protein
MNGYDNWRATAPEDDGPIPGDCPVCDGGDGAPCSEGCDELVTRRKARPAIRGAYEAAYIALSLARGYEAEGDSVREPRIRAVLDQVGAYRRFIRAMRVLLRLQAEDIGTMDTLPAPAEAAAE